MGTSILEIHSTAQGYPGGPDWHYVVVSDTEMPAVNQMHIGGRLPDNDCGVACTMSVLIARGIACNGLTVETQEGTTTGGTYMSAIVSTLARYGVASHIENNTPGPGWVMNPAWGGEIPPSQCGPYLAATTGWRVVIDDPAPASTTTTVPTGTPEAQAQEDDDDMVRSFPRPDGSGTDHYFLDRASGVVTHCFEGAGNEPPYSVDALPGLWSAIISGGVSPQRRVFFHGLAGGVGGVHAILWATEDAIDGSTNGWTAPVQLAEQP